MTHIALIIYVALIIILTIKLNRSNKEVLRLRKMLRNYDKDKMLESRYPYAEVR